MRPLWVHRPSRRGEMSLLLEFFVTFALLGLSGGALVVTAPPEVAGRYEAAIVSPTTDITPRTPFRDPANFGVDKAIFRLSHIVSHLQKSCATPLLWFRAFQSRIKPYRLSSSSCEFI